MTSSTDNYEWLWTTLANILSSPHITMPQNTGHIRMGHGPIDVFSTRFINTFTEDVKANVAGRDMTRDDLKASLLALQKHWNSSNVQFSPSAQSAVSHLVGRDWNNNQTSVYRIMTWFLLRPPGRPRTLKINTKYKLARGESNVVINCALLTHIYSIIVAGGRNRINVINLQGDASLFGI